MELYRIRGLGKKPVIVDGFRVNMAAVDVLRAVDLLSDDKINNSIKVRICLRLLLKGKSTFRARFLSFRRKEMLLDRILDEIAGKKGEGPKIIDFRKDAELIYAALLQSYGLDFARDYIDWRVFPSLISAVSKQTRLYEIMQIRACEVPSSAKAGEEYVNRLLRLKNKFSLESADLQEGLNRLFDRLGGTNKENPVRGGTR